MCPLPRLLVRPVTPRATRDVTSQTTLKSRTLWHLSVSTIFFAPLCRPLPKNLELKQWRTWSNSLWIWIRIQYFKWIRIRIQGFDDQIKNLLNTFMIKNCNLLFPSLHKGRPNYKRSFQPSKKNIQHLKKRRNVWTFYHFWGSFLPSWILIRIQGPHQIRIQSGSGSTTLSVEETDMSSFKIKTRVRLEKTGGMSCTKIFCTGPDSDLVTNTNLK
jgi:hypothetical protein